MFSSFSMSLPFLNSATAATGQVKPRAMTDRARGTSMMISFSVGFAPVLILIKYSRPTQSNPSGDVEEDNSRG